MIFSRYGQALQLLDQMIATGQFSGFVDQSHRLIMENKSDRQLWELWLHRVFDTPYSEFKNGLLRSTESQDMSFEDKVTVIDDSAALLASFVPSQE